MICRPDSHTLHATCLALGGRGVLLRGPSGSGKSDLALRLISQPLRVPHLIQARLVADDRVIVWPGTGRFTGRLMARAPAALAGRLEVRGVGIITVEAVAEVPIALVADLVAPADIDRLPDHCTRIEIESISFPIMSLAPFEASAPIKLALALARLAPI